MTLNQIINMISGKYYAMPIHSGICLKCKKIFYCKYGGRSINYCSPKCANESRKKQVEVICQFCGKEFKKVYCYSKQNKRHFCSYKCWYSFFKGKNCHFWKRGYFFDGQGYKKIMINGKPVSEHRYIMEKILKRKLGGKGIELVHHIDGNKSNNDPKNLIVMTWEDHNRIHMTKHH